MLITPISISWTNRKMSLTLWKTHFLMPKDIWKIFISVWEEIGLRWNVCGRVGWVFALQTQRTNFLNSFLISLICLFRTLKPFMVVWLFQIKNLWMRNRGKKLLFEIWYNFDQIFYLLRFLKLPYEFFKNLNC